MDIRTIRNMLAAGKSIADIADFYGVTRQAVYQKIKSHESLSAETGKAHLTPTEARMAGKTLIDPETGYAVTKTGTGGQIMARIGDPKVTAFVQYHMDMMAMRQGCDKRNVQDLYQRFYRYLAYCAEHAIIPSNMNAYYAIGVSKQNISSWHLGQNGTPEHKEFADNVIEFFSSIHEQGALEGVINPITSIFWQKAYDGLSDAPKVEVQVKDALGERRSAQQIAESYGDLPD